MLFNSIGYLIFLPVVFILYWFVVNKSYKQQNILLLIASYFFYACWDWRFLFLLIFSTLLDYSTGLKIYQSQSTKMRRLWLCISVIMNLGFLGFFKYYNFFVDSFATLLNSIGFKPHFATLNIILPIGISFYTFHGLSYVFDIYNKKIKPTTNLIDYSVFVCFFPLLVAGPIERATHLLPQVENPRRFDYQNAVNGLRQILWGFFKKLVIADNCAEFANQIFSNSANYSGSTLVVGVVLFAFQIYGDFSGYSDIALGSARLLGFDLLRNFAFPYFSRDIAEFWRRWHISLSSWFKDYLYIPLGGSKVGIWKRVRNTFIIFLVSGFWHGANWTFVIWGGLNALFIMPLILFNKNRDNFEIVAKGKVLPSVKDFLNILLTFTLTLIAWVFFRAESVTHAIQFISGIFSSSVFTIPQVMPNTLFFIIGIFLVIEWLGREQKFAIENLGLEWPRLMRWSFYALIVFSIGMFMQTTGTPFIYFQF